MAFSFVQQNNVLDMAKEAFLTANPTKIAIVWGKIQKESQGSFENFSKITGRLLCHFSLEEDSGKGIQIMLNKISQEIAFVYCSRDILEKWMLYQRYWRISLSNAAVQDVHSFVVLLNHEIIVGSTIHKLQDVFKKDYLELWRTLFKNKNNDPRCKMALKLFEEHQPSNKNI